MWLRCNRMCIMGYNILMLHPYCLLLLLCSVPLWFQMTKPEISTKKITKSMLLKQRFHEYCPDEILHMAWQEYCCRDYELLFSCFNWEYIFFVKCHPHEVKCRDMRNWWIKHEAWWCFWSLLMVTYDFIHNKFWDVIACLFGCAYCIMLCHKSIKVYWWIWKMLVTCLACSHYVNPHWFLLKSVV